MTKITEHWEDGAIETTVTETTKFIAQNSHDGTFYIIDLSDELMPRVAGKGSFIEIEAID